MLVGELTDSTITSAPVFRVNARSVMLESKAMDSGMRVKLYVSNPALMYYFIKYCDVGTRHYFKGPLNVSAYTFDDSTRAFSSVRLSVNAVRPLVNMDEDGEVVHSTATRINTADFERNHRFLKLKFIVYKYVWEHIDDEDIVINKGLSVETFALQLSDMYENLVASRLSISNFNPVYMEETVTRPATNPATNRPVPRVMRTVYSYNETVQRLEDWSHPSLDSRRMADDTIPFEASLFVAPPTARQPPTPAASTLTATTALTSVAGEDMNEND